MCSRPPQQVRDLIQELAAAGAQAQFQGELLTIQAMLAVMQGKPTEAIQLSDQAIHQLPVERAFFRSLAADSLGMGHSLAGDYRRPPCGPSSRSWIFPCSPTMSC